MKGNYESLTALAERIETIENAKEDYIVPTDKLFMRNPWEIDISGTPNTYQLTEVAHGQIAARLKIPKVYYDRMAGIPRLREYNVNSLWNHNPELWMVRTLEGKARAFLSNAFKPYDNYDMLQALLPVIEEHGDIRAHAIGLTERRMYLQFTFPRLRAEIKPGDVVQAGIAVSNSEIGLGAVDVRAFLMRLVCINGAVAESLLRKYHIGRRLGEEDFEAGIFKPDTLEADVKAFQLGLRDVVGAALNEAAFDKRVALMQGAASDQMKDPEGVVTNVTRRFGMTEGEDKNIRNNLITGGDTSRWGLSNAVTVLAKQIDNLDRQVEVEGIGWDLITLKPNEWEMLQN